MNKAYARLYFLRRLKGLGASPKTLKEVYVLFVRSILEQCAPLWAGNLSKKSSKALSRVEKNALRIIFPTKSYEESTKCLNLVRLDERRINLTKTFAQKMAKNPRFEHLFKKRTGSKTRSDCKFVIPKTRRNRHKFSPLPVFCKLLNGQTKDVFRTCPL